MSERDRIVVVGSLNADFVVRVSRFPVAGETVTGDGFTIFSGGKGANQAFGAARLGARVSMVGRVGNDAHAAWLKQSLAEAGVDVSHVTADPDVSSGVAVISIDGSGQNQIVVVPGSNGAFRPELLAPSRELIRSARVVLLQLEIPMPTVIAAARYAREGGAIVILDPAPAAELSDELLGLVDYLTPNETELALVTGGAAEAELGVEEIVWRARLLLERGAGAVIVKMGARGALFVDGSGKHPVAPKQVVAVDTTAAGDAFNAAFALAVEAFGSVAEACMFANAAAACSVTRYGAQSGMPTIDEVSAMLPR
jgi:ribokinase